LCFYNTSCRKCAKHSVRRGADLVVSLLERDAALAQLGLLARRVARGGPGEVVLVRGEAGIGKTAVLARFVDQLDSALRGLWGRCDPLTAPRPLGPLIDALAGLDATAGVRLAAAVDAGDTAALYRRLLGVLRDGGRWVWVIEDAHWADSATLDLMRFVARRIEALPLLLVISYRDDELAQTHPLVLTLGDVATCATVSRIGLEPLSPQAVAVLAAGSGLNAERLHQLTAGNPFFVTEVLAAGPDVLTREHLPRSISEAVWGRLGRLSEKARETAYAVAVCGPRADVALLDKLCPEAGPALGECLHNGVLVADGNSVAFRHELARRATLAQIPDFDRIELHKHALTVLAEPPVDANTLAILAFHAGEASDTDATIRYGIAAAERAASLGAHREAAGSYTLALRHAGAVPGERKVIWHERHAFSSYLCGQIETAVTSWREAIALRHQLGDRLEEGEAWRWLSLMLLAFEGTSAATEAGRASLRLLETLDPSPQLAWSLVNLAQMSAMSYDPAVTEYVDRAIALGTQLGDDAVVLQARTFAALDNVFRTDTGWEELTTAWSEAESTEGLAEHFAHVGICLCWTAAIHYDLDRTALYLAEMTAFCADHDFGVYLALVNSAGVLAALHRGQWDRAVLSADEVLTRPELSPLHRVLPLIALAVIRARRGHRSVAPLLDEAVTHAERDHVGRLCLVFAARAEVAWLAGDDDTARAEAQVGLAAVTEHADPWLVGPLRRWVRLAGGTPETTSGDALTPFESEIRGHWQAAAEAWTDRGCPYDAALAQLGGDIDAVRSALDTFRGLGAKAAARRAQDRLTALRGRAPHSLRADTLSDPHTLTRRQREVLDLLVGGGSNAEIAAALHISHKTVGHHVAAILTKLGVDNRAQAVAHAIKRQAEKA
jgi:DNA-binding CsgD family transcriptional regulator